MQKSLIIIFGILLMSTGVNAQDQDSKFSTVVIKTSAVCEMCVETIQKGYAFEKGVKESKVDLETNTVAVTYRTNKTDTESIKEALTLMGYAADDMKPDPEAYEGLHFCCKADHDHGDH